MLHMNRHDSHNHSYSHSHPHANATEPESPLSATPPMNGAEGSTRCDCCKSCGAILELGGCGHRFHPRCIYSFPMVQCELCSVPVGTVTIFRVFRNSSNSMARKGKWSSDEHKYANMMMKQFQMGALPLVDGLHLRGFIANLLQCDPLRVTKKYSGHAIGKQNFFFQHHKSYCYNLHTKMQKRISSLRNHFYWHLQYRCKFGHSMNIQELKSAEADYWIREFLKFANKTGQLVVWAPALVAVESPVPSLVQEREESEPPVQLAASGSLGRGATSVVKIELAASSPPYTSPPPQPVLPVAPEPPMAVVDTVEDLDMGTQIEPPPPAAAAPHHPSFKLDHHASPSPPLGAVSPLSFDEWREEEAPSFMDVLDKALVADFAKQSGSAQFSATLSEILGSSSGGSSSGSGMALPSLAQTAAGTSGSATATATAPNSRCSLRDWLLEEDSRWSDSMAGNSWSFSFPLSDCA